MRKNILLFFIIQGGNFVFPLFAFPLVAKSVGVVQFGKLMTINAVAVFLAMVVEYGFGFTGARDVAKMQNKKHSVNRKFWSVFSAKFAIMVCCLIFAVFLSLLCLDFFKEWLLAVLSFLIVVAAWLSPLWLLQGLNKTVVLSLAVVVPKILAVLIGLGVNIDLVVASLILSLPALVSSVVMLAYCCINYIFFPKNHRWREGMILELRNGFAMFVANSITFVYTGFNAVILAGMSGVHAAGLYSAAEKIARAGIAVIGVTSQACYPIICSAKSDSERADVFKKAVFVSFAIGLSGFLVSVLLAERIMIAFFGRDFFQAVSVFRVMALLFLIMPIAICYGQLKIIAKNNEHSLRRIYVISSAVYIVLVAPLVFYMSEVGAALALVLSEMIATILMVKSTKEKVQ